MKNILYLKENFFYHIAMVIKSKIKINNSLMIIKSIAISNLQWTNNMRGDLAAESIPYGVSWAPHTTVSIFEEIGQANACLSIPKLIRIIALLDGHLHAGDSIEVGVVGARLALVVDEKESCFTNTIKSLQIFILVTDEVLYAGVSG